MKSVIVIRHTKSDHTNMIPDFDRPIKDDRKDDPAMIAREIASKKAIPQSVISSPAKRTMQTAKILCEKWKLPAKDIKTVEAIYDGSVSDILAAAQKADPKDEIIAIICHNPAITGFVNQYSDTHIDNVPTTGAVCIAFDTDDWKKIKSKGKLEWFLRPKGLD